MLAAIRDGDAKELAELIRQDPDFNVNKDRSGDGNTLLHYACHSDSRSAVIPLLLAHPGIDVNLKDDNGYTAYFGAFYYGRTSCVREMLKDSRVKVNEPHSNGFTPLWFAASYGQIDIIKWCIASGREIDLGTAGDDETDAIGAAKKRAFWYIDDLKTRKTEVETLLERFKNDATETRHAVRVELGWYDDVAAEMFALVIFVSDGLLRTKDTTIPTPAARFFSIAAQLPLELQMVLCCRVMGSCKEIIPGKESEVAFRELATIYCLKSTSC